MREMCVPDPPLEPQGWPEDASYDALIGGWSLYQRAKGHKTSTDDVLTAWMALDCMQGERPRRYLDLGCGVGSVLLMTSYALRPEYGLGIEAQVQSAMMAKASIAKLPEPVNLEVQQGDFRELGARSDEQCFDLVTGSPPYFPLGTGVVPKDYQRRACRFELRGGVEGYCQAAVKVMGDDARLVLVFQTEWDDRVLHAASEVGLHLHRRADVLMRVDRARPFLSVYAFGRDRQSIQATGFAIRDEEGHITPEYREARSRLGLSTHP